LAALSSVEAFAFERFLDRLHQRLDFLHFLRHDERADLRQRLAGRAEHVAALALGLDPLALGEIVEGVLDRFGDHLLHVLVAHVDRAFELDDFLVAGLHVAGQDAEDAVGVDLELHADAGHALRRGLEFEFENAERPVVAREFALALQHLDLHRFLVVDGGGEKFARLGRDGGVARMMTFIRPPKVSMPSESGVTSSSTMFCTPPSRMPAWMVAPRATASSGLAWCSARARKFPSPARGPSASGSGRRRE
jgi:hypothetical protein